MRSYPLSLLSLVLQLNMMGFFFIAMPWDHQQLVAYRLDSDADAIAKPYPYWVLDELSVLHLLDANSRAFLPIWVIVMVNRASILDSADQSLLPAVYKEVGAALHIDPTGLGSLTLFRSIVQSACYPLAATFLVAISSTFFEVAVSRGLNGIGLAIVTPAIMSLVTDSTDETNRGMAFGWLHLTGNIDSIIGGLSAVLISSTSFMGIPGWRIAFHLVGLISVIVGILIRLFANDPHFSDSNAQAQIPRKTLLVRTERPS